MSLSDYVQVTITTDPTGRTYGDGSDGPAVLDDPGALTAHDPDVQASAHGWRCLNRSCPARAPKRGPTPPTCYTCGKAMMLVYAPPLKTERELALYVATGALSPEEVWEQTRVDELRASEVRNRVMVCYPRSIAYMDSIV